MQWRKLITLGCLMGALALLSGCKEEQVQVGARAPALAAYDLAGQQVELAHWQGKQIYLNFWSSFRLWWLSGRDGHVGETEQNLRG